MSPLVLIYVVTILLVMRLLLMRLVPPATVTRIISSVRYFPAEPENQRSKADDSKQAATVQKAAGYRLAWLAELSV